MAIGRSPGICACSIRRARLSPQNGAFLQASRLETRHREAPARFYCVQTTCPTSASIRAAHPSMIANFEAARDDDLLKRFPGPRSWARPLPIIARSARPFFTSISSSQALVTTAQPQEHSANAPDEKILVDQRRRMRRRSRQRQARKIRHYRELRCAQSFRDHMEISQSGDEGYCTFHATLIISPGLVRPGTRLNYRVEGCAESPSLAERKAILSLISLLREASLWEHLLSNVSKAGRARELHENELQSLTVYCGELLECEESGSSETGYTCYSRARFRGLEHSLEAAGEASSRELAREAALITLIAKLKEDGLWGRILQKEPSETETRTALAPSSDDAAGDATHLSASIDASDTLGAEEEELLRIFELMGQDERLFRLHVHQTISLPNFTCQVTLTMPGRDESIVAEISAPQVKQAKARALLRVISKLQEAGLWEHLLRAAFFPPKASLSLDEDLLCNMRFAKKELLEATVSLRKTFPRQNSTPWALGQPPIPSAGYYRRRSRILTKRRSHYLQDPKASAIRKVQAALPVSAFKESILEMMRSATLSLIVAETGSGKSTQVPQMILDDAIDKGVGGECRILCVQPRRLAAQLLARRVAYERCETVGDSVGYTVRFDSLFPARGGSITYCTTGVMLNFLKDGFHRTGPYSHILLDEVHVRDIGIDFVMLLLKRHLRHCREAGLPEPKIIVMSATVDLELFSSYFCNEGPDGRPLPAPHISIPGRQYHVQRHFLSEILEASAASLEPDVMSQLLSERDTAEFLKKQTQYFADEDRPGTEAQKDIRNPLSEEPSEEPAPKVPQKAASILLENYVDPLIPNGLIAALVFRLLKTTQNGAILIFLPGLQEILNAKETLSQFARMLDIDLEDSDRFRILPLHSILSEEQQELSNDVSEGCRRIIFATDIAEASLTIPDVRYVIDTGRAKRMIYDNRQRSSRLACGWINQPSATQRAGRAGRVQNGHYYFLGTNSLFNSLRATASPEILRADLQTMCLVAKSIIPNQPILETLQEAIEPPEDDSVLAAVDSLKWLKALDENEALTSVGRILNLLPLTPDCGKLVILGAIFRCLDPLLILAAMGADKTIFSRGLTEQEKQMGGEERAKYARNSASEHLAAVNAFHALREEWRTGSFESARDLAISTRLNLRKYVEILNMCRHVLGTLKHEGLILSLPDTRADEGPFGGSELNTNSHNIPLIKALLLCCLSPQIAAPNMDRRKPSESAWKKYCTQTDKSARFSMKALSVDWRDLPEALALYTGKMGVPNTEMTLHNVSLVSPLAACLFGGNLEWQHGELLVNSWLNIAVDIKDATMSKDQAAAEMIELSSALDQAITAMFDSLNFERRRSSRREIRRSRLMYKTRLKTIAVLQRSAMDVFNRDLFKIGNDHAREWEDPAIEEEPPETTLQAVQ